MSSEKKAVKALLKSFKKVKSISLIDKANKKGKTISNFLFTVETKEGKKSKLEKWLLDLTTEKKDKVKKKEGKKKKEKTKKKDSPKNSEKPKPEKPLAGSNAGKTTSEKVEREKSGKKAKGLNVKEIPNKDKDLSKEEEKMKKASPAPNSKAQVKNQKADNLKIIIGIGPAIERILKESQIDTFSKLAEANPEDLRVLLVEKGGTRYNANDPASWPEQAAFAAADDKEGLSKLQEKIKEENKLS